MRKLLTIGLLLVGHVVACAQPYPELTPGRQVVSGLSQATSIRVDPEGLLYIADLGRHVVDIRRVDGSPLHRLGGPGTGDQQFDSPMDVDPTNGLILAVADAGNNRIARFTALHQLRESILLYGTSGEDAGLSAAVVEGEDLRDAMTPGRPVAVVLNESNETFAIDEVRGVVAKWDISRRLVRVFGNEPGYGQLQLPVDLAIAGDQLFVADSGKGSIVVFDFFGGFVTEFGGGRLADLAGLGASDGELWVVHGRQLSIMSPAGTFEQGYRLPDAMPEVVDIAVRGRSLYLLTRTGVSYLTLDTHGRPPTIGR